jgi:hypothetical protein
MTFSIQGENSMKKMVTIQKGGQQKEIQNPVCIVIIRPLRKLFGSFWKFVNCGDRRQAGMLGSACQAMK